MRHVLKWPSEVSQPRMNFAKNLLITWCLETQGANSWLFSTWWMRSPLCSPNHICSCLTERKCGPCPFSAILSHGNGFSVSSLSLSPAPPSLSSTYAYVHSAVGKRSRLKCTKENVDQWELFNWTPSFYMLFGETANKKARGPLARSFLSLFILRHDAQSY